MARIECRWCSRTVRKHGDLCKECTVVSQLNRARITEIEDAVKMYDMGFKVTVDKNGHFDYSLGEKHA